MAKSQNSHDITNRKGDHIRLSLDPGSQAQYSVFAKYRLPYTILPEASLEAVDTTYNLLGKKLSMPFTIASMTGGSEKGRLINTNLAIAAEECGIALGCGSQRIGLEKPEAKDTFELVRKNAPKSVIFANMGIVQFNYGHGIDSYKQVVDMIEADALYLHINPLQECLEPGGDTDFSNLLSKIEQVVKEVGVPVFVKEVGHGISTRDAKRLFELGVKGIDTAGVGGTSYAWIEAKRSANEDFQSWFKDYGIHTDESVKQVAASRATDDQIIIASGGVRSPVDGLKCRALGADLFSAAVPFLKPAIESPEAVIDVIKNWQRGLQVAMFASGVNTWDQAKDIDLQVANKD